MARTGLPPDILLNQPPPANIVCRDTAWSCPVPVKSVSAAAAAGWRRQQQDSVKEARVAGPVRLTPFCWARWPVVQQHVRCSL